MTTRMTAQRLGLLIDAGQTAEVRAAITEQPTLLTATVERAGEDGWTPLHLAVAAGRAEVVTELVGAGADVQATTGDGRTPLQVALVDAPELVAVLRGLGVPVDAGTAAFLGDVPALLAQLDTSAPLRSPAVGTSLLGWAARGGSAPAVRLLLGRGAAPDGEVLHAAAAAGAAPVVGLLLSAGVPVDARDPDSGRTPLHSAVAGPGEGAPATVQLLLAAGADVDATTADGASALDIARVASARGRAGAAPGAGPAVVDEVLELLRAAGADG
ncbi:MULTISPECIES: ankyrin repeat domain-containing protein [unclassified Modestobacter]